jgi:hypothetical protein
MKFFNNLPKTVFTSSIGDFRISDFFTYLDVERTTIEEGTITIDNKTTLLEAAYTVYTDSDSFWAIVAANNVINPFFLLEDNASIYSKNNEEKINMTLFPTAGATTGGVAFPVGSIVLPYIGNTGPAYNYGSTGNFQLNGPFALIEETSFYDGSMVIGPQRGGTGPFIRVNATQDLVAVIQLNSDGSYSSAGNYYTADKTSYLNKTISVSTPQDAKIIYKQPKSSNITIDEELEMVTPGDPSLLAIETTVSVKQYIDTVSKIVQAYVPSQLGLVQSSFITTKYK